MGVPFTISFGVSGLNPSTLGGLHSLEVLAPGVLVSVLLYAFGQRIYLGDLYRAYTFTVDEVVESTPDHETRISLDAVTSVELGEDPEDQFPVIEIRHGGELSVFEPAEEILPAIFGALTAVASVNRENRRQILLEQVKSQLSDL